jgi:stage IV sporulation protein A
MTEYSEALRDMQTKHNISKGKTSKWQIGCNYKTLSLDDLYIGEIYKLCDTNLKSGGSYYNRSKYSYEVNYIDKELRYATLDLRISKVEGITKMSELIDSWEKQIKEVSSEILNFDESTGERSLWEVIRYIPLFDAKLDKKPARQAGDIQLEVDVDIKKEYDKIKYALYQANETGYGIVSPSADEITLQEPQIVKQGGRFGVKLKASAPSLHLIKSDIETVINPIVGTEKQSEELMQYLTSEIENDPSKIWETNLFGKSLYDLVSDGLQTKLSKMPHESRMKLRDTLTRIINEGSGGLICIIL